MRGRLDVVERERQGQEPILFGREGVSGRKATDFFLSEKQNRDFKYI
jgi:hypothetical protein